MDPAPIDNRKGQVPKAALAFTDAKPERKIGGHTMPIIYPPHIEANEALQLYASQVLLRGKIRVLPGKQATSFAFVSCDRGSLKSDVIIKTEKDRNRALDGDIVYIELVNKPGDGNNGAITSQVLDSSLCDPSIARAGVSNIVNIESLALDPGAALSSDISTKESRNFWSDDPIQRRLWDPAYDILQPKKLSTRAATSSGEAESSKGKGNPEAQQCEGRVVHVVKPSTGKRRVVGRLIKIGNNRLGLVCANKSLPIFMIPSYEKVNNVGKPLDDNPNFLYQAFYRYGQWKDSSTFPVCSDVVTLGDAFNPEVATQALLTELDLDHGDFDSKVLSDVERAVCEGRAAAGNHALKVGLEGCVDLGWMPTESDLKGRRDFRNERVFTIDPTTAKDLDDALHVKQISPDEVEIGVHIADVSHFLKPGSDVDREAQYRATTVYLVDQTVPMLPRPLCEIACSLNENVDRLAFSCVWTMRMNGNLEIKSGLQGRNTVWYGKSVIRSCARLDYNTAQNIIERKVAEGEIDPDESIWPKARRPTGGHTMDDVARDVKLLHKIAKARRALRFENGAIELHGVKLNFYFSENDQTTPDLCKPYPIKDSNRLIEEYMLLANYLVAQRLITHAREFALLRLHPPPLEDALGNVMRVANTLGYTIDCSSSEGLQKSLLKISQGCNDVDVLQSITALLMVPMQCAKYFAAGNSNEEEWRHWALNMPYYTHFTSPIRRYADVIVHRVLQATLEGEHAVKNFPMPMCEIEEVCTQCNDQKEKSRKAQEGSDILFLALFLKRKPVTKVVAIVTSFGEKTFTVFVPSLGLRQTVFLEEHGDFLQWEMNRKEARLTLRKLNNTASAKTRGSDEQSMEWPPSQPVALLCLFSKLYVSCNCTAKLPVGIKVRIVAPFL